MDRSFAYVGDSKRPATLGLDGWLERWRDRKRGGRVCEREGSSRWCWKTSALCRPVHIMICCCDRIGTAIRMSYKDIK